LLLLRFQLGSRFGGAVEENSLIKKVLVGFGPYAASSFALLNDRR
jgi:hypothetical protein